MSIVGLLGWLTHTWLTPKEYGSMAAAYFEESSASVSSGDRSALPLIEAEQDNTYREIALFLRRERHFRLGEYTQAAAALREIIRSAASPISYQKAEWHLLLTCLSANGKHNSSFQALLQAILSNPRREARDLRERL